MSNFQETVSALGQLKAQLEILTQNKIKETGQQLANLEEELAKIEKREFDENTEGLHHLKTDLCKIERKEFSLLKIFGIERTESVHSNFLAWLLDPSESHGIGKSFVENMLNKIISGAKNRDLSGLDFSNLQVRREESGEKSRLDIRITDPKGSFQCVIENKIFSNEGEKQTERLYDDFHGHFQRELFVFLTLDRNEKPSNKENFVSFTYEDVKPLLIDLLPVSGDDTKFLIKNYLHTLERLIMSAKFEGFSDRTKLYYKYYNQIHDVQRAFDQDRQLLLSTLEDEIKRSLSKTDKIWTIKKTGSDISIWKADWHPQDGVGVSFYLEPSKSEEAVTLSVYGEPTTFSAKFASFFKKRLESTEKVPGGFRKNFQTGVSMFLEKTLSLAQEKDPVPKILKSLDEMVACFEAIIDKSIEEFNKA